MPELIRSIANRLREFVGNRRRAPRYKIRLSAELALMLAAPGSTSRAIDPGLKLSGYTRDISATGLALVVPTIRIGGKYITGSNETLQITLSLPHGAVELHVTPVRYGPFEEDATHGEYLIGAQIERMSIADRSSFNSFLQTVSKQ